MRATRRARAWSEPACSTCPAILLSGGKARSWETVTVAKVNQLSRYVAISKPLWSRAEGYHELDERADGTTLLTFHETYHAYNPILRDGAGTSRARKDLRGQPVHL